MQCFKGGLRNALRIRAESDVDEDEQGLSAKLDLAKVYIEIGDLDNAEVILMEIVSLGDEQQQATAQELLDGMKS